VQGCGQFFLVVEVMGEQGHCGGVLLFRECGCAFVQSLPSL
jgi:hypothetical protein